MIKRILKRNSKSFLNLRPNQDYLSYPNEIFNKEQMKKEISKAKYFWNINNCDIVRPTQSLNIRSQTLVSLRDYLINEIYEFYVCLVY